MRSKIFENIRFVILRFRFNLNKKGFTNFVQNLLKLMISNLKKNIRENGIYYFFQSIIRLLFNLKYITIWFNDFYKFWTWFYIRFKSTRIFKFQGDIYQYFYHIYSITWNNERSVEIPIIWKFVNQYKDKKILEVGNVLSHFFDFKHDIVDKYEKHNKVINQDVVEFKPGKKYDLIVSISTLEHVGWDEIPQEPFKILKAIENLKNLLVQGGKIVVTLPKGHSPVLDNLLTKNRLKFSKKYYLKRKSKSNRWKEVNWNKISNIKYGTFTRYSATGIVIGIFEKEIN